MSALVNEREQGDDRRLEEDAGFHSAIKSLRGTIVMADVTKEREQKTDDRLAADARLRALLYKYGTQPRQEARISGP